MSEEVTPEYIFRKLNDEKRTGEIIQLSDDFYKKAKLCVDALSRNPETANESANAKRMLANLCEKRKQKILLYLAYGKPLPKPMPSEEEALYTEVQKILNSETGEAKITKIKINSELPEIMTPYGKKIGPFKTGDVVEVIDEKEAGFLLNNKIGEKV